MLSNIRFGADSHLRWKRALLVASFATVSVGTPLFSGGKLALSNLLPILFVVTCIAERLAKPSMGVNMRAVQALLGLNVLAVTSFVIFLLRFDWVPNAPVLAFLNVEVLFCFFLIEHAKQNPEKFREDVRTGIFCSVALMTVIAWVKLRSGEPELWFYLGTDDKSHTAVLLVMEAFILIHFYAGRLDVLVGLGLVLMSFITVSRLPLLLIPSIMLALAKGSRFNIGLTLAVLCLGLALYPVMGEDIQDLFRLFERLSSLDAVTGEESTRAHTLLIESGWLTKFADPWTFFFGIGPGNYSKALMTFQINLNELESIDPALVQVAREGNAPLHSSPISLFLEQNILVSIALLYLAWRGCRRILKARDLRVLTFFAGLLAASTFYSLHNKPYVYLLGTTVGVMMATQGTRASKNHRLAKRVPMLPDFRNTARTGGVPPLV